MAIKTPETTEATEATETATPDAVAQKKAKKANPALVAVAQKKAKKANPALVAALSGINTALAPKSTSDADYEARQAGREERKIAALDSLTSGKADTWTYKKDETAPNGKGKCVKVSRKLNPAKTVKVVLRAIRNGATGDEIAATGVQARFPWEMVRDQLVQFASESKFHVAGFLSAFVLKDEAAVAEAPAEPAPVDETQAVAEEAAPVVEEAAPKGKKGKGRRAA